MQAGDGDQDQARAKTLRHLNLARFSVKWKKDNYCISHSSPVQLCLYKICGKKCLSVFIFLTGTLTVERASGYTGYTYVRIARREREREREREGKTNLTRPPTSQLLHIFFELFAHKISIFDFPPDPILAETLAIVIFNDFQNEQPATHQLLFF